MIVEKISLDKDNRMLRIGFGKNKGLWFFRVDLWVVGYRFKKYNIENRDSINVYPQEKDLPVKLYTKSDFYTVLNYFLLNHWDMREDYIDGLYHLTIKLKQPLLTKRINLMKKYIEEHKSIGVIINYE